MKKVSKVKEWLEEGKKQFIVKDYYESGNIRLVQRIKDDAIFHVGPQKCDIYFKIIEFSEDCIHVKIKCGSSSSKGYKMLNCQINAIGMNEEGSSVLNWEGVTDDDTATAEDLPTMVNPGTARNYSD
jgi:hypothetical protein